MSCMEFVSIQPHVWTAINIHGVKIAEVTVPARRGSESLVPMDGHTFTTDELGSILSFMQTTGHCKGPNTEVCLSCPNEGRCEWS